MRFRRMLSALAVSLLFSATAFAQKAPAGQGAFVPVNEVPLADQLPAAPLLVAAYAFVWVAVMVYVWSIWRRMNKVEDDTRALAQKMPRR